MKKLLSGLAVFLFVLSSFPVLSTQAQTNSATCGDFDVWIWAQTVFEEDKNANAALDPDGNGLACEHLPFVGFAPLPGVNAKPKNIFPVTNLKVKDADKVTVRWNGDFKTILLHETSRLVTSSDVLACGADQSRDFMKWVLSWVDPSDIYVEPNYGTMADYNEHQGYIWMEIAGDWYMLNEVMIRSGWSQYSDEGWHHLHADTLKKAEAFATSHVLGAHLTCGGTDLPANSSADAEILATAATVQPDHGQLLDAPNYYGIFLGQEGPHSERTVATGTNDRPGNSTETQANEYTESAPLVNAGVVNTGNGVVNQPAEAVYEAPAEPVYEQPAEVVYEQPAEVVYEEPAAVVYEEPAAECHWAYGICLPVVGDLNCGDIAAKDFWADPSDPYGLDRDGDGIACES